MSKINDGGNAFPACNEANVNGTMGMTLRDWFAGQALNAMASTPHETTNAAKAAGMARTEFVTRCAYELADAMLAAREAGQP